jgi:hypothetical protein
MKIFYAESPLQILNCIEANNFYFNNEYSYLIVLVSKEATNLEYKQMLGSLKEWVGKIHIINQRQPFLNSVFFKTYFELIKLKIKINSCSVFCIGEPRSLIAWHLFNLFRPKKAIFLDDGANTIFIFDQMVTHGLRIDDFIQKSENNIKNYVLKPLQRKSYSEVPIEYFTNIEKKGSIDMKISNNRYFLIRQLIAPKPINTQSVFFYGSKCTEAGIMSARNELAYLKFVYDYYQSRYCNVTYIPHRQESSEKLKEVNNIGFKVVQKEYPAEINFVKDNELPKEIAAGWSTVILNANSLLPDEIDITCFQLPTEVLRGNDQLRAAAIYEHIKTIPNITYIVIDNDIFSV